MDKRLELTLPTILSGEQVMTFCTYAVLCARQDMQFHEPDPAMSEYIAAHLGRVIALGFFAGWDKHPIPYNVAEAEASLAAYPRPAELHRYSRQLGDRCLFLYSQDIVPAHPNRDAERTVVVLGRYGYQMAAANASGWSDFERRLLTRLQDHFIDYGSLLGLTGVLLGFTSVGPKLITPMHPVVTTNDFLETLTVFTREPTHQHWLDLKRAKELHQWSDPDFSFELPAEPTE